ncbi:hypothetical protein HYT24_01355, partial [Candidatus Pacearchaeota archaeon]|nr:hypothetical protein [Candidatus Pacearchaeota archaeon]
MQKRTWFIIIGIILFVVIASFFLKNLNLDPDYKAEVERQNIEKKAHAENAQMTFEVKAPENTIEGDTVWIYLHNQKGYKMEKIGDFTYNINVSINELPELTENGNVKYRYSRNGYDFHTAEYLEEDTNNYFWREKGRKTAFENGKTQKDEIERWRWFPPVGTPIVKTSNITPEGNFLPRIKGMEFRSGQIIEDLYVDAFDDFFNSTAKHLKETGYRWVELDPPEQMTLVDGMPKVINKIGEAPNYPNEEKLKEEILAYKKEGLKVVLAPQMCCEIIDFSNRSDEWWDAYFSEVEKFLVRMAKVAEETGVDSFHYAAGADYQGSDKDERWRNLFREIRKHYSGEVGEMVWNFENYGIIPEAKDITWGNELDYFYIAIDAPISTKDNPTDEELEENAGKVLDGAKELNTMYGKPVFARTTYFNVKETWKGNSFYDIGSVPWISESEKSLQESIYEFKPEDQARVVNAYFHAI